VEKVLYASSYSFNLVKVNELTAQPCIEITGIPRPLAVRVLCHLWLELDWRKQEMALLRVAEAAKELGVKEDTIRAWIVQRRMTSVKLGAAVRIPSDEVQRLILEGTIPAKKRGAR
jgi:excisionase family DNA binding protein